MTSKHARRISSIFSLGSDSSVKSLDSPNTPPSPHGPSISPETGSAILSKPVITPPAIETSAIETSAIETSAIETPAIETPPSPHPSLHSPPPPLHDPPPPPQAHGQNNDVLTPNSPLLSPLPERLASPIGDSFRSRSVSRDGSRDGRRNSQAKNRLHSESRLSRPRSWLSTRSKPESQGDGDGPGSEAWLVYPDTTIPYDVLPLVHFQKVQELWQDHGNTIIYLLPEGFDLGPSFKLDSASFGSSRRLSALVGGRYSTIGHSRSPSQAGDSLKVEKRAQSLSLLATPDSGSPPGSPDLSTSTSRSYQWRRVASESYEERERELHIRIPLLLQTDSNNPDLTLNSQDFETLITARNVFAFLVGQPLVATSKYPTLFAIFLKIAEYLNLLEFTNLDGSTYGEESTSSFRRYLGDFSLGDVRTSADRTIEAIVLGERMKSFELYNEAFVHGVGKYEEIMKLQSPKFGLISEITRKRLERAQLDLSIRIKTVRARLDDFEFPSLFAGIASSTNSSESKIVRFKAWKASFFNMRRHVLSLYRNRYGSWPPRARSKKNSFEESGLNRILLLELYQDFSDLYDILVDRNALTTRSADLDTDPISAADSEDFAPALRRVMNEFDHSSPPVQPPIPFDIPQIPSPLSMRRGFKDLDPRKQKKERTKALHNDEINNALMQSYNRESLKATPFLEAFMAFERKQCHGRSNDDMMDNRIGQWMFMYAVLQSLPLVVIDAPGIKYTDGVEYFLCEVPKGTAPWCPDDSTRNRSWYGIAGGTGVVSLPHELVEYGVEGIYHRSHCWTVAEKWLPEDITTNTTIINDGDIVNNYLLDTPESEIGTPTLQLPPELPDDSRCSSPSVSSHRNSIYLGLEALPLPAGVAPSGAKHSAIHNPQKSFEDILGPVKPKSKKK